MNEKVLEISNKTNNILNGDLILWDIGGGSTLLYIALGIFIFFGILMSYHEHFIGENDSILESFKIRNKEKISDSSKKDEEIINLSNNKLNNNNIGKYLINLDYNIRISINKYMINNTKLSFFLVIVFLITFFSSPVIGMMNENKIKSSVNKASEEIHQLTKKSNEYEIASIIKNKDSKDTYIISYLDNGIMKDINYEGNIKLNGDVDNSSIYITSYMARDDILKYLINEEGLNYLVKYDKFIEDKEDEIGELTVKDIIEIK